MLLDGEEVELESERFILELSNAGRVGLLQSKPINLASIKALFLS